MATQGVFEIFQEAAKQENDQAKAAYLQQRGNYFAVRSVLQGCYDPNIKFLLPEGEPPYQLPDGISVETRLHSLAKRFDIFVEGGRPVASQSKREILFIELLETVHPEDAKIILNMKDKKDPVEGINRRVAALAFPELFPFLDPNEIEEPKPTTKRTPRAKSTTATKRGNGTTTGTKKAPARNRKTAAKSTKD